MLAMLNPDEKMLALAIIAGVVIAAIINGMVFGKRRAKGENFPPAHSLGDPPCAGPDEGPYGDLGPFIERIKAWSAGMGRRSLPTTTMDSDDERQYVYDFMRAQVFRIEEDLTNGLVQQCNMDHFEAAIKGREAADRYRNRARNAGWNI